MTKVTKKKPKHLHKEAGRPTKMTPELVEKLERAFGMGFTDDQACLFVGIDKHTLYSYCDKFPEFSTKKELLKKKPDLKAKLNIVNAINSKDSSISLPTSKWWVERKLKDEFSLRVENTGRDGKDLIPDRIIRDDIK